MPKDAPSLHTIRLGTIESKILEGDWIAGAPSVRGHVIDEAASSLRQLMLVSADLRGVSCSLNEVNVQSAVEDLKHLYDSNILQFWV